ncbi:hypothetical protein ACWGQ5_56375 [Streptomyces sp. NPDC055722]
MTSRAWSHTICPGPSVGSTHRTAPATPCRGFPIADQLAVYNYNRRP